MSGPGFELEVVLFNLWCGVFEHLQERKSINSPNCVITQGTPWSDPLLLADFSFCLLCRFTVLTSFAPTRTPSNPANSPSHQNQVNASPDLSPAYLLVWIRKLKCKPNLQLISHQNFGANPMKCLSSQNTIHSLTPIVLSCAGGEVCHHLKESVSSLCCRATVCKSI